MRRRKGQSSANAAWGLGRPKQGARRLVSGRARKRRVLARGWYCRHESHRHADLKHTNLTELFIGRP